MGDQDKLYRGCEQILVTGVVLSGESDGVEDLSRGAGKYSGRWICGRFGDKEYSYLVGQRSGYCRSQCGKNVRGSNGDGNWLRN